MKIISQKGQVSFIGKIIFMVFIVLAGIWFIKTYIIDKGGQSTDELQTCTTLGLGKGVCMESRGPNCYAFGNCPAAKKYCCVDLNALGKDGAMPIEYGGDSDYDFLVGYIGTSNPYVPPAIPAKPANCEWYNSDYTALRCKVSSIITVPIKIQAIQNGRGALSVSAFPYFVVNEDTTTLTSIQGTETKLLVKDPIEVTVSVVIPAKFALLGNTVKIYPYVKCITLECKRSDLNARGILRRNLDPNTYMSVTYVSTL